MSLKKRINTTLALGLTISSVYVSTNTVYAMNTDINKEVVKTNTKIELSLVEKNEIETIKTGIVTTSVLNVRMEASKEAEKIGALTENMVVTVLETKGEWTKVEYADQKQGWVSSEFIANEKGKVNVDELNLRSQPTTEDDNKELLKRNTELEILSVLEIENKEKETTETWYQVKVVEADETTETETATDKESTTETKKQDEKKEEKTGYVFGELVLTQSQEIKLEEARKKAEAEKAAQEEAKKNEASEKTVQSNTVVSNSSSNSASSSNSSSSESSVSGRTITVNASAYSGHGITATGTVPKWGTIAVDPSVIPYGTKVYIPMFDKVFIAEDCGGAIKGNKIDIFMNSAEETKNFGRRNIEIKILG